MCVYSVCHSCVGTADFMAFLSAPKMACTPVEPAERRFAKLSSHSVPGARASGA